MGQYHLGCVACGQTYADDGLRLRCDLEHEPALLRTHYSEQHFAPRGDARGVARYASWLPLRHPELPTDAYSATFRSKDLAHALGLKELWIAFSGNWPERGAYAPSATFKDVEAAVIASRFAREERILVTASAGNTAAALALACNDARVPVRIILPRSAYDRLPISRALQEHVQFITLNGDASYDDAIALARELGSDAPFAFEGGVWNVARRDGIGTIFLGAVEAMGRIPEIYVQGIGSGAGAIAAFEAASRLVADGSFGARLPRLVLVQNAPMSPVVDAWSHGSRQLLAASPEQRRAALAHIAAPVLATAGPPYAVRGGLFDLLTATLGSTVAVPNEDAMAAMDLFLETEGRDIDAAAGVALAGLITSLREHRIDPEASVLLHITGGGRSHLPGKVRIAPRIATSIDAAALPLSESGLDAVREKLLNQSQAA